MKRWLLLGSGAAIFGCAQRPVTQVPDPIVAHVVPATDPAPPPAPVPASRPRSWIADTAALHRLAADSVQDLKDREMLERLHDVAPVVPAIAVGPEADADLAALFDINVARYSEHDRVRFYLDFFQGPARERMSVWLARLPVYEPMIRATLVANGLPQDLVYLALIESGYSNTAVSRSRAVGMWQFMRGTAKDYGIRVDQWVDARRDPITATNSAARFLADLTKRFAGSYYLAAAAYNGGGGTVSRGLRKLGSGADQDYFEEADTDAELAEDLNGDDRFFHLSDTRYLRKETKDYVPKLIAAAMIAKQPTKYGFLPIPAAEPYAVDSVAVSEPTGLDAVARASGVDRETLTALNPHLLRGITPPDSPAWWVRVPIGFGPRTDSVLATYSSADRIPGLAHVVKRKETLSSIARRYGLSVTELAGFNPGLDRTTGLKAGAEIRIPGIAALRRYAASDKAGAASNGIHIVRIGETLGGIAQRNRMSVAQLRAANNLSGNMIRVGQRLRVPGGTAAPAASKSRRVTASSPAPAKKGKAAATTHVVRRGDTLSELARRYGVSVRSIMSANGLRSAQSLRAGARLHIPG